MVAVVALGGCAATAPTGAGGARLVASRGAALALPASASAPLGRDATPPRPPLPERAGLVVTTMACWYPAARQATVGEALPRLDPKRCHTVSERVVLDGPADAETLHRVEALTVQDVGLKLEAVTAPSDDGD